MTASWMLVRSNVDQIITY